MCVCVREREKERERKRERGERERGGGGGEELVLESSGKEEERSQLVSTGRLVLVSQPELPPFLQVQSCHLAHQRLAVPRHKAQGSAGNE